MKTLIEVIDLQSHTIINRIRMNTGDKPSEAALTPDGRTLLVVNGGSNTVSFIDPASNFETSRINVGNRPRFAPHRFNRKQGLCVQLPFQYHFSHKYRQ